MDFTPNELIIDPEGCTCQDCTDGISYPEDELDLIIDELLPAIMAHKISIVNRTGKGVVQDG